MSAQLNNLNPPPSLIGIGIDCQLLLQQTLQQQTPVSAAAKNAQVAQNGLVHLRYLQQVVH